MNLIKNRNFNVLFFGRLFTNIGDSVYYVAIMWFVLKLGGDSPIYTGIAGFLFTFTEGLSIFYGPIIDKINEKKLLITASLLQAILLCILVITSIYGLLNVWILLFFIPLLSFLSQLTYPLESVLLPKVISKQNLVKANSLMSIAYKGCDFLFNGIAGLMLATLSMSIILTFNSVIFFMSTIIFLYLKLNIKKIKKNRGLREEWYEYKQDFKEGLFFIKNGVILQLLLPLVFVNFLLSFVVVVLPLFANNIGGGASSYGIMTAALGLGSLAGAAGAEKVSQKFPFGKILAAGFLLSGVSWLIMILLSNSLIWFVYVFMFISYLSIGAINVLFSTIFQQLPDESMIGRVNTTNISLITIAMPLGSLVGGLLANITSTLFAMSLFGIGMLILSVFYTTSNKIRRLPKVVDIDSSYVKLVKTKFDG